MPYYFAIGMEVQMFIQMIECYYLSFHFVLTQKKLVQKMSYIFRCPKNEENINLPILKICVKKISFPKKFCQTNYHSAVSGVRKEKFN